MAQVTVEFWVMRIVVTAPWRRRVDLLPAHTKAAIMAQVRAGDYCLLPSGNICEPIDVYESQSQALERSVAEAKAHPNEKYLIVLNADPEDLAKAPGAVHE